MEIGKYRKLMPEEVDRLAGMLWVKRAKAELAALPESAPERAEDREPRAVRKPRVGGERGRVVEAKGRPRVDARSAAVPKNPKKMMAPPWVKREAESPDRPERSAPGALKATPPWAKRAKVERSDRRENAPDRGGKEIRDARGPRTPRTGDGMGRGAESTGRPRVDGRSGGLKKATPGSGRSVRRDAPSSGKRTGGGPKTAARGRGGSGRFRKG